MPSPISAEYLGNLLETSINISSDSNERLGKAFKKWALKNHPDKYKGSKSCSEQTEIFQNVSNCMDAFKSGKLKESFIYSSEKSKEEFLNTKFSCSNKQSFEEDYSDYSDEMSGDEIPVLKEHRKNLKEAAKNNADCFLKKNPGLSPTFKKKLTEFFRSFPQQLWHKEEDELVSVLQNSPNISANEISHYISSMKEKRFEKAKKNISFFNSMHRDLSPEQKEKAAQFIKEVPSFFIYDCDDTEILANAIKNNPNASIDQLKIDMGLKK